ncbi:6553_t:CDS:1, partial [Racocetra fulgida]
EENSDKQIAYITFERETAVRTALMLTKAVIGNCQITVKPADDASSSDECLDGGEGYDGQEGKSKVAILAEIIATGIQLQESILKKFYEYDGM